MEITISVDLTRDEVNEYAGILGCEVGELQDQFGRHGKAALAEYLNMFRGQGVFTRGQDILEYRLLLLIENAFDGAYSVKIRSANIVDELNQLLGEIDGELELMSKRPRSMFIYEIKPSSYSRLHANLNTVHHE